MLKSARNQSQFEFKRIDGTTVDLDHPRHVTNVCRMQQCHTRDKYWLFSIWLCRSWRQVTCKYFCLSYDWLTCSGSAAWKDCLKKPFVTKFLLKCHATLSQYTLNPGGDTYLESAQVKIISVKPLISHLIQWANIHLTRLKTNVPSFYDWQFDKLIFYNLMCLGNGNEMKTKNKWMNCFYK